MNFVIITHTTKVIKDPEGSQAKMILERHNKHLGARSEMGHTKGQRQGKEADFLKGNTR